MDEPEIGEPTPGQRLREFVDTVYNSVKAFAEAVGMQPSNLHKYLNDEREACISVLARFAEAGCDIHWMVSGEGDMFADSEKGREFRRRLGGGGEESSLISTPAFIREQNKMMEEFERLREALWEGSPEGREHLLVEQNRLLERWMRLLERENYQQRGRIEVLERLLGNVSS